MKLKVFCTFLLCATFLLTPLLIRLIENSKSTSFYSVTEEEKSNFEKEIKAIFHFSTLKNTFILSPFHSSKIFSENLSKHEPVASSIFIPPPEHI